MAHDNIEFDTVLSAGAVDRVFRTAIRDEAPGAELGSIDLAEGHTDEVASYAQGKTLVSQWCVQLYVRDDGATRHVQLVVLGSSLLGKAWHGTRGSFSLSAGQLKAVAVINALKVAQRAVG